MNAITVTATIVILSFVLLPAVGELLRIRAERSNPLRKLRVPTRRHQVLAHASGSFVGFR